MRDAGSDKDPRPLIGQATLALGEGFLQRPAHTLQGLVAVGTCRGPCTLSLSLSLSLSLCAAFRIMVQHVYRLIRHNSVG